MDPKDAFGRNVRRLRKEKGLSQEDLAYRAHLHRTYVGGVERGERNISLENIVAISAALGCSVADLFVGIGPRAGARQGR